MIWNEISNISTFYAGGSDAIISVAWHFDRWIMTGKETNPIIYSYNGVNWYNNTNIGSVAGNTVNSVYYKTVFRNNYLIIFFYKSITNKFKNLI